MMGKTIEIPASIRRKIADGKKIHIELGCGQRKRHPEAIGIDQLAYAGVDIVGDILAVIKELPDRSTENVYSYHCFEHLNDIGSVIEQLGRIMVPSAKLLVVVPHFSNPYYYSDPTHRQPFGIYTFSYFAEDGIFSRKVPTYLRSLNFKLCEVSLKFKSPKPFYVRWGFKKILERVVNMNSYVQEFYEENLCWLLPCYEIRYILERH